MDVYLIKSLMNSIYCQLTSKVGVVKEPHTSKCTSSKGFTVPLTGTQMNIYLCVAWMLTVNIESLRVYLSTTDLMALRFI